MTSEAQELFPNGLCSEVKNIPRENTYWMKKISGFINIKYMSQPSYDKQETLTEQANEYF